MNEILNKQGEFWIDDEDKFMGKLKFENNQFYLTCDLTNYSQYIQKINGNINGIPLTLSDCHYSYKLNGKITFMCETIFKNYNKEELLFNKARIKFNNLDYWIQYPFIGCERLEELLQNFGNKNTCALDDFEINLICKKDNVNIAMPYTFTFELNYYEKTDFKNILEDSEKIGNLLTLLMYNKNNIDEILLITEDNEVKVLSNQLKQIPANINPRNTLLEFHEINENFLDIISKWFTNYELINPTLYLYFIHTGSNFNAESLLIGYTEALEAYIRKTNHFKKYYMSDKEYETFKNAYHEWINGIEITVDGFKDSLENKIKYGNEYSFRKRINLLLKHLKEYNLIKHLKNKYQNNFTDIAIDTRNYYTHYSEKKEIVKTKGELVLLCYDLRLLLELCILYELGISKEIIDSKLEKKYDSTRILSNYE